MFVLAGFDGEGHKIRHGLLRLSNEFSTDSFTSKLYCPRTQVRARLAFLTCNPPLLTNEAVEASCRRPSGGSPVS